MGVLDTGAFSTVPGPRVLPYSEYDVPGTLHMAGFNVFLRVVGSRRLQYKTP